MKHPKLTLASTHRLLCLNQVEVAPGAVATAEVVLTVKDVSVWDPAVRTWVVHGGQALVMAAASSRDIRVSAALAL